MVSTYHQYISSPLWEGKRYGSGQFFSPLKDLSEQTILVENSEENKNDSYRQRTKYDDKVDSYFSTYNLEILLSHKDSYLEGKLNSADDVDCYAFSYKQRVFYEKMGISSKITIRLENLTEGCDYDLVVYDKDGNQIGIAKKNGDGNKELTLPEWDHGTDYVIRVENRNGEAVDAEGAYRIQIAEEKTPNKSHGQSQVQDQTSKESEAGYTEKVDRLHDEQYSALPEENRYQGDESLEELLKRMAFGERLSRQEQEYLKIYANLHDYERAEAACKVQNKLYPEIVDRLKNAGINLEGKAWELEIEAYGKVTVSGDLTEEEREKTEKILEEEFADQLWDTYMQASDIDSERYNQISAYREISSFLQKATNGQYKWEDIYKDIDKYGSIKVAGLPDKLCELLNSQESNGKYEQLRDDIYLLWSAQGWTEESSWTDFRVKYRLDDAGMSVMQ